MANTLADVVINNEDWVDISLETGIPVGTGVSIQNKGTELVLIWVSNTKPSQDSTDGLIVYTLPNQLSVRVIRNGNEKIWLKTISTVLKSRVNISLLEE